MSISKPTQAIDGNDATIARETAIFAPYAMHSADSAGRVHAESPHAYRGPYQRDRDRIVHCSAYRRLSYKMQVFTGEFGDYHRTRLTHTLEVASIARSIARALRLNEDFVEALALLHDIGHPPYGHAGEETLDACLAEDGGFNHNRQALRIVEHLETRYPDFPGLNLSREVLEGQAYRAKETISPLLEVQVVDVADGIAYNTHDADDALELGLLVIGDLLEQPLWREAYARVQVQYANLNSDALRLAVLHELINWQVGDVLQATTGRIEEHRLRTVTDVRHAPPVVLPSNDVTALRDSFQQHLFQNVYRHPEVLTQRREAQAALRAMFDHFVAEPEKLPVTFRPAVSEINIRRFVADVLAGMTDRFAQNVFREIAV